MAETVTESVAETVTESVAETVIRDRDRVRVRDRGRVWIVLVIPIQALFPHHPPPKGLDAPLMSPMTSRTGPRGRSETTFVAVAVDRGRVRGRVRGDRACDTGPSTLPTPPPQSKLARIYYRNLLVEGAGMRPLVGDTCPETE